MVVSDRPGVRGHRATAETPGAPASPPSSGSPAWLFVERKGPSVAFHVRQAEDVAGGARGGRRRDRPRGGDAPGWRPRARALPRPVGRRPAAAGRRRQARGGRAAHRPRRPGAVVRARRRAERRRCVRGGRSPRATRAGDRVGVTVAVHGRSRRHRRSCSRVADLRLASARASGRSSARLARAGARPRPTAPSRGRQVAAIGSRGDRRGGLRRRSSAAVSGTSPNRIVSAVAAASPPHSSAPWRSGGASLVGSRMYM